MIPNKSCSAGYTRGFRKKEKRYMKKDQCGMHVLGITGGALSCDEFAPGPVCLQGDHSDADYRNMVLTPILAQ